MYKSVGVLPTGERLTVKGTSAGWSRIQTSKGIGWVSSSYLSTKAPAATAPTQHPAPPKPQAPRPEAIQ
ncbi:SH3 domain-containing protein, partial [Escherichia coli]|nr:SH3 domain-containing protein [Escherichia coli]